MNYNYLHKTSSTLKTMITDDLEYNKHTDSLQIRDGDSPASPLLALESCHSEMPLPQRTTQNSMWIRFKSESFMSFSRFNATYTAGMRILVFLKLCMNSKSIFTFLL